MGSPEEAIFGRLSNTRAVSTLCSTRISPGHIDYNVALPAISYFLVYDPREHAMGRDPNVGSPRYQVDIWSTSFGQMMSLANAVKNSLRDYGGTTWATIQRIFFEGQMRFADIDPESNRITHHTAQDYTVWWNT
jgi:hypothetical protein